jgi:fluoride exporter
VPILFVSLFGLLGVLCRYGIDLWVGQRYAPNFPISTFVINATGCAIAGIVFALGSAGKLPSPALTTGLMVGFCGGFTTFSAYALQTVLLAEKTGWTSALGYFLISPLIGLAAAFLSVAATRSLL